ncbi:MAG: hypothetical protein ACRDLF_13565 [Solirubrobacteraceae bacterium]
MSRPFQIALLAFATLVLAWFFVLHRPGGSSTSASSPSVSSPAGSSSSGSPAGGSSSVYHGSAPGVEGLTKDIQKAHGAVATSEQKAQQLQSKSAQASGEAAGGGTPAAGGARNVASATRTHPGASASTPASASAAAGSHTQTHASAGTASSSASKTAAGTPQRTPRAQGGSAAAAPSNSAPAMQAIVAGELKQGKVVLLLFWNPRSTDDAAVERQVRAATHKLGHGVAVHTARAKQVNAFGSITRNIQVYQTPTLLIVNPKLQVTTLTGYTDAYAIEQAVAEARK